MQELGVPKVCHALTLGQDADEQRWMDAALTTRKATLWNVSCEWSHPTCNIGASNCAGEDFLSSDWELTSMVAEGITRLERSSQGFLRIVIYTRAGAKRLEVLS